MRSAILRHWALFLVLLTSIIWLLPAPPPVYAGSKKLQEYKIKAAFIYNFAKYVTWPKKTFVDENAPLILGLMGDNPFAKEIYKIDGKLVHDRKLRVIVIKDFAQTKSCNLLYLSPSESGKMSEIQAFLRHENILTVSDMADFAVGGGMIELIIVNGKIRFIINPEAAEQAGLKISSQLLKLAIILNKGELK